MSEIIKVGMADMKICKSPDKLTTLGLGSCVGVAIMDPGTKISGLIHIMLPDSTKIKNNTNISKFADTGIKAMVEAMACEGAIKERMVAKIAGGAKMFTFSNAVSTDTMNIGERNAEAAREVLKGLGIRLLAEDTGLNYGRTIVFDSVDGTLLIKAVGKPEKVI